MKKTLEQIKEESLKEIAELKKEITILQKNIHDAELSVKNASSLEELENVFDGVIDLEYGLNHIIII